jgi:hypothetical protein
VFRRMLQAGNPPDQWAALMKSSRSLAGEVMSSVTGAASEEP